jgi:MoaA/NifB/PqqE/SkfB family radical SAM enzyme
MSDQEYQSRRPMMCKAPWSQLNIGPLGDLKLCTVGKKHGSYIGEVDSLEDYYNSDIINNIRNNFKKGEWPSACVACKDNRDNGIPAHIDNDHYVNLPWSDENFNAPNKKILSLEYTPSNLCNQSCAMCGSIYSSKWIGLDKRAKKEGLEFRENSGLTNLHTKAFQATDKDMQKILDVLPSIKFLLIKGGEPFADPRNIRVLKEIVDKKYEMRILIVSNWASITEEIWDILEKLNKNPNVDLLVTASLDGTGKVYEWIRSTPYEQTLENMETYLRRTGKRVIASSTVSLYTLWTLKDSANELLKTGLVDVFAYYYVFLPKYSAYSIVPQTDIDRLVTEFFNNPTYLRNPIIFERTERLRTLKYSATAVDNSNALRWIEYINSLRGFNIYDYNPELAAWADKVKQNEK